jgi:hypothetical protein
MLERIISTECGGLDIAVFAHGPNGPYSVRYGLEVSPRTACISQALESYHGALHHALVCAGAMGPTA